MRRKKYQSLAVFEELEPRLLFSAEGFDAISAFTVSRQSDLDAHILVIDSPRPSSHDVSFRSSSPHLKPLGPLELEQLALTTAANDADKELSVPVLDDQTTHSARNEVIFIDGNTPAYEQLIDNITADAGDTHYRIVILAPEADGIAQISETLANEESIDAVHIVSHGTDGAIKLGNAILSAGTLEQYSSDISAWKQALDRNADLLIYGCNLASSASGEQFVQTLGALTDADVAASEDLTGHSSLGGDWDLEFQVGVIETDIAFDNDLQQQWKSALAGSWFDAGTRAPIGSSTSGDDIFVGDGTNDTSIDGADGDDVLYGGDGDDNLTGGNGADFILGGDGNDILNGGNFADTLHGGRGDDIINGENNADTLIGGGGNDTLNGGDEDDLFLFSGAQSGDFYTVDGGNHNDTIDVSAFVSAIDNGSTITVQMGGGDSFTINYTNVEGVVIPGDPGNKAPAADAGPDQTVATGALVTLDAAASSDPDPETPTYSWQQISGPWVTLSSSTAEMPTFTAPASSTVLEFALVASDASISDVDVVRITVGGGNVSPAAVAGGSYVINEGDSLLLDGAGSSDADGTIVEYRWDLNNDLDYSDYTSASATLTLPWATIATWGLNDGDVGGKDYTIGLQVLDNQGATHAATTTVTINDSAPILTTTGTGAATTGVAYTLNLAATDAGTDTITGWTINWGDGTIGTFTGNPAAVTHTYSAAGFTYNVLAAATNEDGTHLQNEFVVASSNNDRVLRYGPDGSFLQAFATSDGSDDPVDTVIGPDGNLYLSGWRSDDVLRYNATTGAFIDTFVPAGRGGLNNAAGLAFGPDGHLYVASRVTSEVLRFDSSSGAFIDAFVTAGSGGLSQPEGLVFGADGDLYVSDYRADNSAVYRYDGATGDFDPGFVSSASNGLDRLEDIAFGPDGNLYVASDNGDSVLRYNAATGAYMDAFVPSGSNGLKNATGVGFGPDGHLYVSSWGSNEVLRFNGLTGAIIDKFISAGSGGLDEPDYFNFIPQHQVTLSSGPTIFGTVFEDIDGDGDILDDGTGAAGVTVDLYVDDGAVAGEIDAADSLVTSDSTDGSGNYSFSTLSDATYWVVVDSATIDPDAGFNAGFSAGDAWAEQTYGVAGSVSFAGGYSYAASAGAFYGGMRSETADAAGALTTAEHVTRVVISGSDVSNVDSGFSFNVITSTGDDGAPSGPSIQGSLRQFLFNSNAIDNTLHGLNASQFAIPTTDSNYNGSGNGEFTITPTAALPDIVDSVVLDATTQAGYITPIVELVGALAGGANGLTITGNDSTIRGLAINRFDIGIEIFGDNARIESNFIGTDVTGQIDRGNTRHGIGATNASGMIIGGAGAGNVISGNGAYGIAIVEAGSINNTIQGNFIGTNAAGTLAIANDGDGIALFDAFVPAATGGPQNTTIGGATADLRNIISGNGAAGIRLGAASNDALVAGNYIGTDITGTLDIGNGSIANDGGIYIHLASTSNVIGGPGVNAGNLIAFNAGAGVTVVGPVTINNRIQQNLIHSNTQPGINLVAGNQNIQAPGISSVVTDEAGTVTITGSFADAAFGFETLTIEYFATPLNLEESQTYLDSATLTTDVSGFTTINNVISVNLAAGQYLTATVTDSSGNTSEFSVARIAERLNSPPGGTVTIDNVAPAEGDILTVTNTITDADGITDPISYQWQRDGVAITSANNGSYTATTSDVGTVISVVASYTDDRGTAETVASIGTAPVAATNNAPTVTLTNRVLTLDENNDASAPLRVADITVTDDGSGVNALTLSGQDAASFEINAGALWLRAGVALNFEALARLEVTVSVDDPTIGSGPEDSEAMLVAVADINESPELILNNIAIDENTDTSAGYVVAVLSAIDPDANETSTYSIVGGADQAFFSIVNGSELVFSAGTLDYETKSSYNVIVRVADKDGLSSDKTLTVAINDVAENIDPETPPVTPPEPEEEPAPVIDLASPNGTLPPASSAPSNTPAAANDGPGSSSSSASSAEDAGAESDGSNAQVPTTIADVFTEGSFAAGNATQEAIDFDNSFEQSQRDTRSKNAAKAIAELGPADAFTVEIAGQFATQENDIGPMRGFSLTNNASFQNDLDEFRQALAAENATDQLVVGSSVAVTTGASLGYVIWLVRGGVLLSTVLSSLPAWRLIDPLPVLATDLDDTDEDEDDESLASMLERENAAADDDEHGNS